MRSLPLVRGALAGLAYFGVVFAAGFVLGTLRVLLVVPQLGEAAAVALELPIMLVLSWIACRWMVRRFEVPPLLAARLLMGAMAFALLLIAELALSLFAFGRPLSAHLALYRELPAILGLAAQIAFATFPVGVRK